VVAGSFRLIENIEDMDDGFCERRSRAPIAEVWPKALQGAVVREEALEGLLAERFVVSVDLGVEEGVRKEEHIRARRWQDAIPGGELEEEGKRKDKRAEAVKAVGNWKENRAKAFGDRRTRRREVKRMRNEEPKRERVRNEEGEVERRLGEKARGG
jgi:hypothetical protein